MGFHLHGQSQELESGPVNSLKPERHGALWSRISCTRSCSSHVWIGLNWGTSHYAELPPETSRERVPKLRRHLLGDHGGGTDAAAIFLNRSTMFSTTVCLWHSGRPATKFKARWDQWRWGPGKCCTNPNAAAIIRTVTGKSHRHGFPE